MTGHVFVIKGDTRHVACDTFLWAGDRALRPTDNWPVSAADAADRMDRDVRAAYQAEQRFTLPLDPDPERPDDPVAIITAVPYDGVRAASDIVPRIEEYLGVAADIAAKRRDAQTRRARERPLLAVPLFGVAGGGGGPVRGDIFRAEYDACLRFVADHDVDIVIVLRNPRDYDLAQEIRRQDARAWASLPAELIDHAERLGAMASRHRLVPFMGSGISMSAGAPDWNGLIRRLATAVGIDESAVDALSESHDVLDQAAYLHRQYAQKHPADPDAFAKQVIEAVNVPRYGLAPAMLASLEAEQAITLNYDELFETAAADVGLPRRVIPGPASDEERWLLKLHGSVTEPASIILTRDDYLGFTAERTALSSLVKATLMTRQLLFVGFGVKDPHFHEIVHDVRRALPEGAGRFGTVLTLRDDPVTRLLWEDHLEFISIPEVMLIDVFLDALMAHAASTHSYLLAHGYTSTLGAPEAALRDAVEQFESALDPVARESAAWPLLRDRLRGLGWDGE